MYVTRPLSMYKKYPSALSLPPPEGPNSGILVIHDEEAEPNCCFGLMGNSDVLRELPFPQNKNLRTHYTTTSTGAGGQPHTTHHYTRVAFIPVLDQPLSSNQYYVIQPLGKHKGEAFTNSKEEDINKCCFCYFVNDQKPQPFDPDNIYQQIEISYKHPGFSAKSVAPDGFPPAFLRRKRWSMVIKKTTPHNLNIGDEAPGLDAALRNRLPDFDSLPPLSSSSSKSSRPVVVGKWYCPFIFIKESSLSLKEQMTVSMYYEMTLEQRWEQIFFCENSFNEDDAAVVDVSVQTEVVSLPGVTEAVPYENINGVMWFKNINNGGGREVSVGLSKKITERMKWEQERFGFIRGNERKVNVKRVEGFKGVGEWIRFGCYVLVERFILKRMDGSLVLTYDFKHTHQIRTKWE